MQTGDWGSYQVDERGVLIDPAKLTHKLDPCTSIESFLSEWQGAVPSKSDEAPLASRAVFPTICDVVCLQRLDIFQLEEPLMQQFSAISKISQIIRKQNGWIPVRSIFVVDKPNSYTMTVYIEGAGPPYRHRLRPLGKNNVRDMSTWTEKETLQVYQSQERNPGTITFYVEYLDAPDRYIIVDDPAICLGRRLYRFAGYPATQYYILEKEVEHDCLEAEGGAGPTCLIESGPYVYARDGWKLTGSFYGFDYEMSSSNLYTIYKREDPFPRCCVMLGPMDRSEEWTVSGQFYGFDVPLPGSCHYVLQHCIRSISSNAASVCRHRLSTSHAKPPWDFRMNIYVFPAEGQDCSVWI